MTTTMFEQGFAEGMSKTASDSGDDPNRRMSGVAAGALGGVGAFTTAGLVNNAFVGSLVKDMRKNKHVLTDAEVKDLARSLGEKNYHIHDGNPLLAAHVPHGIGQKEQIVSQLKSLGMDEKKAKKFVEEGGSLFSRKSSRAIAAHEFGHGNNSRNKILRGLQSLRRPGNFVGGVAGVGMASAADVDSNTAKYYAPLVAAAGTAPQLIDEGLATYKGLKALKRVGASAEEMKAARRTLGKAFGTYGTIAAGIVGAPIAIRAARKWARDGHLFGKKKTDSSRR